MIKGTEKDEKKKIINRHNSNKIIIFKNEFFRRDTKLEFKKKIISFRVIMISKIWK